MLFLHVDFTVMDILADKTSKKIGPLFKLKLLTLNSCKKKKQTRRKSDPVLKPR